MRAITWEDDMNFFGVADLNKGAALAEGQEMGMRPEHMIPCDAAQGTVTGTVELLENLGEYILAHLVTATGTSFVAKIERVDGLKNGQQMSFHTLDKNTHRFDIKTQQRL